MTTIRRKLRLSRDFSLLSAFLLPRYLIEQSCGIRLLILALKYSALYYLFISINFWKSSIRKFSTICISHFLHGATKIIYVYELNSIFIKKNAAFSFVSPQFASFDLSICLTDRIKIRVKSIAHYEFIQAVRESYVIVVDNFMARGHLFHLGSLVCAILIACRYRACPYNARSINLRRNIQIARTDGEINIQWIMRAARTYLARLRCRSTLPYVIYSELDVAGTRQLLRDTRTVIWRLRRRMTLSGKTCSSSTRRTRIFSVMTSHAIIHKLRHRSKNEYVSTRLVIHAQSLDRLSSRKALVILALLVWTTFKRIVSNSGCSCHHLITQSLFYL